MRFHDVIHKLQPEAVVAISGEDVRWVGNEAGVGRITEWSVTPLTPHTTAGSDSINSAIGIDAMDNDLGSRDMLAKANTLYWWPAEVDVSIRPGWFFHETEQPKSVRELAEIYMRSVVETLSCSSTYRQTAPDVSKAPTALTLWVSNNGLTAVSPTT